MARQKAVVVLDWKFDSLITKLIEIVIRTCTFLRYFECTVILFLIK